MGRKMEREGVVHDRGFGVLDCKQCKMGIWHSLVSGVGGVGRSALNDA